MQIKAGKTRINWFLQNTQSKETGNSDKSVKRKNSRKNTSGSLQGNVLEKFSPPLKKFKFPMLTENENTTRDGSPAPMFISDSKTRLLS